MDAKNGRAVVGNKLLWQAARPTAADLDAGKAYPKPSPASAVLNPANLEVPRHGQALIADTVSGDEGTT